MGWRISYFCIMAVLLWGCADDSYLGAMGESYGVGGQYIPVMVSVGEASGNLVKSGSDEVPENWSNRQICVYAFARGGGISYSSTSSTAPYECLMDGTLADPANPGGRKAVLESNDSYARWEDDKELFYPFGKYRKMSYDFFAYYLDGLKVSVRDYMRDENSVRINLEIDGTQDLMSSKAVLTEKQMGEFSPEEQALVAENAYGYYTAQRNVVPTFYMKHHLARLEFEFVPGYVREEKKTITVHRIEVESRARAYFTVAARDADSLGLAFEDKKKVLTLTEKGGLPMEDDAYVLETLPSYDTKVEPVKIGGSILVAPDEEYRAYAVMSEVREDGTVVASRARTEVLISFAPEVFEAGNQYKVRLVIYGATQVTLSVEMQKWNEGGDIDMDMDKEMENKY